MAALTGFIDRFTTWWKTANGPQRSLVLGGVVAALISVGSIVFWSSQPDFVILFSGLEPEDAAGIIDELEEIEVPYRVNRSGGTIQVPSGRVGELRIRVAGKGLTGGRTIGYEIFDKSNLGMTEFLQHVNYRRALEGELTRTVVSLSEVRNARVHLAIPEQGVFNRDRQEPTASVIVDLKPGARLREDQIRGIYSLMASSVEGLEPNRVTIVDSSGRELGARASSGELAFTSEQLHVQQEVEEYLRTKASSLLEQVLGPGQATVQVHAVLDFERVERSVERFDPVSATIRSEQRISGSASGGDSQETVLTNYEIDKTVESILESMGSVERLSVAVLVNGTYEENADGELAYVERPALELQTLKSIVEDAVGYDADRGDSVEIANLQFAERPEKELATSPLPWWLLFPSMGSLLKSLVILSAIGLVAWGLRQSSRILVEAVEDDRRRRERVLAIETSASETELRKEAIREEMNNLAKERPSEVAQVLRGWLVEEKSS